MLEDEEESKEIMEEIIKNTLLNKFVGKCDHKDTSTNDDKDKENNYK
jgi:hypothetical protein